MNSGEEIDWHDQDKKTEAVLSVLAHIFKVSDEGEACVGMGSQDNCLDAWLKADQKTRELFQDPAVGNIAIPDDSRAIVLPRGERDLGGGGSVIIALPPKGTDSNVTDLALVQKFVLNYVHWPEKPSYNEDWYKETTKIAAITQVLRYIIKNFDVGNACINNDGMARNLFEDKTIGAIEMPVTRGARAIILRSEEQGAGYNGSVWLELPPAAISDNGYWLNYPDRRRE